MSSSFKKDFIKSMKFLTSNQSHIRLRGTDNAQVIMMLSAQHKLPRNNSFHGAKSLCGCCTKYTGPTYHHLMKIVA